jgi:hypothetical protein
MGTSIRRGAVLSVFVGLLIIINSSSAWGIPVTLPSGKVIDLNSEQVELLKQSPGVYFFYQWPDKVIKQNIRYWIVIDLPQDLGGGFLIGPPQNLARGLEMVDAREIEGSETSASKPIPESSDSREGIKPGETTAVTRRHDWQWSFDFGYRIDDFDWNIAGDITGNNPNILSELTWSDLEILQLEFDLTRIFPNKLVLKGEIAYGFIFDGDNQDSDYFGDNRTAEFSRSNNDTGDGHTTDASIGLGYFIPIVPDTVMLIPLIGYSFHLQRLEITDGVQTIATPPLTPNLGPFAGLDSSYDADWYGPWGGLELNLRIDNKERDSLAHKFILSFEYHWVDYDAEANWNLRTDLDHPKSFEHEADGSGIIIMAGYNYFFKPQLSLNVIYKYQEWETDPGTDRIFFADGTQAVTRLNEVNWESSAFMVGITRRF